MWQGRKGNHKKFYLVKWDTIKQPLAEGGLQIRDYGLMNMATGGKILWNLYSNNRHLVSIILRKKYLKGASLRNL